MAAPSLWTPFGELIRSCRNWCGNVATVLLVDFWRLFLSPFLFLCFSVFLLFASIHQGTHITLLMEQPSWLYDGMGTDDKGVLIFSIHDTKCDTRGTHR